MMGENQMKAQETFNKANLAFVEENYPLAESLYSEAITHDSSNADYYLKLATVRQQLENWDESLKDVQKALAIIPKTDSTLTSKANLRKGIALYGICSFNSCLELGRFQDARDTLEIVSQEEGSRAKWIKKCEEKGAVLKVVKVEVDYAKAAAEALEKLNAPREPVRVAKKVRHEW
jgi:tetratricopeptide (TPR) repeat protein